MQLPYAEHKPCCVELTSRINIHVSPCKEKMVLCEILSLYFCIIALSLQLVNKSGPWKLRPLHWLLEKCSCAHMSSVEIKVFTLHNSYIIYLPININYKLCCCCPLICIFTLILELDDIWHIMLMTTPLMGRSRGGSRGSCPPPPLNKIYKYL